MIFINKYIVFIKDIFLICCFGAMLGILVNIIHPNGYELVDKEKVKEKYIVMLSAKEAYIKYKFDVALFIDTRKNESYKTRNIATSINIIADSDKEIDKQIRKSFNLLNQSKEVIFYNHKNNRKSSLRVAHLLHELGYKRNIYILENGIEEWLEDGYPLNNNK